MPSHRLRTTIFGATLAIVTLAVVAVSPPVEVAQAQKCPPTDPKCSAPSPCKFGDVLCGKCVSRSDPATGCGSCKPCAVKNVVTTQCSSTCDYDRCADGYVDRDGDRTNGCEALAPATPLRAFGFVHTATTANSERTDTITCFDHPSLNGYPDAIVNVTPLNRGQNGALNDGRVVVVKEVFYSAWAARERLGSRPGGSPVVDRWCATVLVLDYNLKPFPITNPPTYRLPGTFLSVQVMRP